MPTQRTQPKHPTQRTEIHGNNFDRLSAQLPSRHSRKCNNVYTVHVVYVFILGQNFISNINLALMKIFLQQTFSRIITYEHRSVSGVGGGEIDTLESAKTKKNWTVCTEMKGKYNNFADVGWALRTCNVLVCLLRYLSCILVAKRTFCRCSITHRHLYIKRSTNNSQFIKQHETENSTTRQIQRKTIIFIWQANHTK